ncbi:MAG: type II toxin-antitoxin system prevent-host-death family antitoxin [Propionibacteriaceae bacterium]|nr:type II toxin-antitoxin system prevent-host-death family antitoxin [Propionibacteriaceae bacterium]
MTQTITIREVNQHTSAVMDRAANGEELIVTKNGQPHARISPYKPRNTYEQMVADGRIIPAKTRSYRPIHTIRWTPEVEAALAEDRADRDWMSE